jgi:hypothetical protein
MSIQEKPNVQQINQHNLKHERATSGGEPQG